MTKKSGVPYLNKKYAPEEVFWILYQKEDLGLQYKRIGELFTTVFHTRDESTGQLVSSRHYRANVIPLLTTDFQLIFIENNQKVVVVPAKVRDRNRPENKDIPTKLVDRLPQKALEYS